MTTNPFVVGQWVRGDRFYGRADLIEEVLDGDRNWFWLLGTRRIGKTSLLKQIELLALSRPDPAWFPVFWDLQGADDPDELSRGFEDALMYAGERLEQIGIRPEELEGADLFDNLKQVRRRLRSAGRKLLLLCDEAEQLILIDRRDPSLLSKMRREMQSQDDLRSVLASTIRLWQLASQRGETSPFLHGFTPPLYVQRLDDDEARALVRQGHLPEGSRPPFSEEEVEEIRRRCDNHPYLMQLVCKRHLQIRDLEEALEQVASDQMVSYFFSVDFDMLSPEERNIIRLIGEGSPASSDSILHRLALQPGDLRGILLRLEQLGYIRRNAERRFELQNYFFQRWFRSQRRSSESDAAGAAPPGLRLPVAERPTDVGAVGAESLFDGRYQILGELGRGAAGAVYKARDTIAGETIALKIVHPEYTGDPQSVERFRREVLLQRDLAHPNILKVYHLGQCQGRLYLAMKWVHGGTLGELIRRRGGLPAAEVASLGRKLASALGAAHEREVIHRDVKAQNVIVDEAGEPYLTDFGLARLARSPGVTQSGVFLGTPDYASPEQALLRPVDARSDLYSLGVLLFYAATGKKPFAGATTEEVLALHRTAAPPDPRSHRPGIPEGLAAVILRCLEKEPARRFQRAGDLAAALGGGSA